MTQEREPTTAGKFKLEFFPEELNQLRVEINHHPQLLTILHAQHDKDVYIQICEIAAYCNILVDGTFTHADIVELCDMCRKKLQSMRTILVLPN